MGRLFHQKEEPDDAGDYECDDGQEDGQGGDASAVVGEGVFLQMDAAIGGAVDVFLGFLSIGL